MAPQKELCSPVAAQDGAGAAFHMESPKPAGGPGAPRPAVVSVLPHTVMLKGMGFPWPHPRPPAHEGLRSEARAVLGKECPLRCS